MPSLPRHRPPRKLRRQKRARQKPPPTVAPADGPTIQSEGFAFSALDPVGPGTEITVTNLDGAQHTLTVNG